MAAIAVGFFALLRYGTGPTLRAQGVSGDVLRYLIGLERADSAYAFLVVYVRDDRDFVQIRYAEKTFEINYPLFTEHQRQLEPRVRQALTAIGLEPTASRLGEGRALDAGAEGPPERVAELVGRLLQAVWGVEATTPLGFQWSGFTPERARDPRHSATRISEPT